MAREYLLSTDIAGLAASPWHLRDVAGFARQDPYFKGLEQIAWHTARAQQFVLERFFNFPIIGKHGRMGNALSARDAGDRMKVFVADRLLQSEPHLFSSFRYSGYLNYVLLHAPRGSTNKVRALIREYSHDPRFFLFIENNAVKGSFGEAKELVGEIRNDGVKRVGFMFDLVHYILPYLGTNTFDTMWRRAMERLVELRNFKDREGKSIRIGMHIPIGINGNDSLPLANMENWHWELLVEKLAGWEDSIIVFENQHKNLIRLSREERSEESKRLEGVLAGLNDKKLIGANVL